MAQETPSGEAGDIRRKAIIRLAVAAAITAVALTALWFLDKSGKPAKSPAKPVPAPITTALPTPTRPPEPPPTQQAPAPQESGKTATAPAAAHPAPPPPPSVKPEPAKPAPPPPATAKPAPAPVVPAKQPAITPARTEPAAPSGGTYTVQLGVFSNPVYALELVDRLKKQGIRAYVETRVQVGPFLNRDEAEKAQAELKRLGVSGLVGRSAATK